MGVVGDADQATRKQIGKDNEEAEPHERSLLWIHQLRVGRKRARSPAQREMKCRRGC